MNSPGGHVLPTFLSPPVPSWLARPETAEDEDLPAGRQARTRTIAGTEDTQSEQPPSPATARPDVGQDDDMIYTASGSPFGGSRTARSIAVFDHVSTWDSFPIGLVRGQPPGPAAP